MKNKHSLDIEEVKRIVHSLREDLLSVLDRMVAVNSHSFNSDGIAGVADIVRSELPSAIMWEGTTSSDGTPVWIGRCGPAGQLPLLLVGHLDTVYPPGTFDKNMTLQGSHLLGPGVADMKGGLAVILGALWALDRLQTLPQIPLLLAFNGDEEIGSPGSGQKLEELARSARLGLVFECGGLNGSVVTARRGLRRYMLKIRGRAGHAGNFQVSKQSAVVELARQILQLESLNDSEAGLSVNVGQVKGGRGANVIPEEAEAELEIRFLSQRDGDALEAVLESLANSSQEFGMKSNLVRRHARPPMQHNPGTAQLFQEVVHTGARIKIELSEETRWGASDANLLAAVGLPTIDGLGPVGDLDHSEDERIVKNSLFHRVELLVHLLWDLRKWTQNISDWRSRISY